MKETLREIPKAKRQKAIIEAYFIYGLDVALEVEIAFRETRNEEM